MAFSDRYRLSVHGVLVNDVGQILLLRQTYGDLRWGLPGGAVDPGETVHEALVRECREELGCPIEVCYLSGIYYHHRFEAHVCIFRCKLPVKSTICLSAEHSALCWTPVHKLGTVQQQRVRDCLEFDGNVRSAAFT